MAIAPTWYMASMVAVVPSSWELEKLTERTHSGVPVALNSSTPSLTRQVQDEQEIHLGLGSSELDRSERNMGLQRHQRSGV